MLLEFVSQTWWNTNTHKYTQLNITNLINLFAFCKFLTTPFILLLHRSNAHYSFFSLHSTLSSSNTFFVILLLFHSNWSRQLNETTTKSRRNRDRAGSSTLHWACRVEEAKSAIFCVHAIKTSFEILININLQSS